MDLWIQIKYAHLASSLLEKFVIKRNSPFQANFRCFICGDSKTNKNKARGYIVENSNNLFYKCFNCEYSTHFEVFLKKLDTNLHKDYVFEKYKEKEIEKEHKTPKIKTKNISPSVKGLVKISSLSPTNEAKKYIVKRKIPSKEHYRIFYVEDFNSWVNSIIPNKLNGNIKEGRIVFPIFSQQKELKGVIARSLQKNPKQRYITIMFDPEYPKIYGLEQVDLNKKFYVFEGPIDSFFIENSIALGGTQSSINFFLEKYKENCVIVLDNQPRNEEVCKIFHDKYISNNFSCFIFPKKVKEKDINEMILSGYDASQIKNIIDTNTYSNLKAKIKFQEWKRVNYEKGISSIS